MELGEFQGGLPFILKTRETFVHVATRGNTVRDFKRCTLSGKDPLKQMSAY